MVVHNMADHIVIKREESLIQKKHRWKTSLWMQTLKGFYQHNSPSGGGGGGVNLPML